MNRRLIASIVGSVLLVGATGVLIAPAEQSKGPVFIAGDQPVTEDQVRQRLQSEGYSNVQILRQGSNGFQGRTSRQDQRRFAKWATSRRG